MRRDELVSGSLPQRGRWHIGCWGRGIRSRCLLLLFLSTASLSAADLIRPKVIVVATFEYGADTGDKAGEFQYWVEREKLTGTLTVPGLDHPVRFNDQGVYGVVSGTTVRCGLQMMALGLDPRFDLTQSYWLVNGIAGVSPHVATEGSAAWARQVIDGDIGYEIDSAEAPKDWPYGIMALGNKTPLTPPVIPDWAPKPMAWKLNPALVEWAYHLTKDIALFDDATAQAHRAQYTGFPAALAPPKVFIGDSFASSRYWHGARMQQWADDWTKLYTKGEGSCAMTNMEDHGIASALTRLAALKKVDFSRVLFLRTGSNFSMPPAGQTAAESMVAEYAGLIPSLEAAYRVGSPVVHALVKDWAKYSVTPPAR